jgi:hypothetical protein
VTVTVTLSALPHELLTRTQYVVVVVGETVIDGPVVSTSDCVLPLVPWNH